MSLIFYHTAGCHLCEQAEALLQTLQTGRPDLRWSLVDIADDDALFARYGCSIPVLKRAQEADPERATPPPEAQELAWPFDLRGLIDFLERQDISRSIR